MYGDFMMMADSKIGIILAARGDPQGQLYNLEEDLAETNNLWQEYPEVVDRLKNLLEEFDQSGRSRP